MILEQAVTLTLSLSPDVESRLAKKAKAAGIDLTTYAGRVLQAEAQVPSLEEVLAPVRFRFTRSGLTEDEVIDRYEAEKHAARAAERGRPFDE